MQVIGSFTAAAGGVAQKYLGPFPDGVQIEQIEISVESSSFDVLLSIATFEGQPGNTETDFARGQQQISTDNATTLRTGGAVFSPALRISDGSRLRFPLRPGNNPRYIGVQSQSSAAAATFISFGVTLRFPDAAERRKQKAPRLPGMAPRPGKG